MSATRKLASAYPTFLIREIDLAPQVHLNSRMPMMRIVSSIAESV